jgi:hypothetical protein
MTAHYSEQRKALSSGPIIAKVIVEDLLLELSADPGRSGNILQLASGHISLDKQVGEERLFQ